MLIFAPTKKIKKSTPVSQSRKEIVNNDASPSLLDFPDEILLHIVAQSKQAEATTLMSRLSQTSGTMYRLFQPNLAQQAAKKVLQHVVLRDNHQALKMIAANPRLLFIQASAMDYALAEDGSRRTITGSPYQAMLGAGDFFMLKAVDAYIDKVTDGRTIALEQFLQQFPHGVQGAKSTYDFSALLNAISRETFVNEKLNAQTKAALKKFRDDFKPKEITTGKHFDLHLLVNAINIYDDKFTEWSISKLSLFWRQIIGYLQRMIPACDAPLFCTDIYIHDDTEASQTLMTLLNGDAFFPSINKPNSGLGFTHAIHSGGAWLWSGHVIIRDTVNEYMARKDASFSALQDKILHTHYHRP